MKIASATRQLHGVAVTFAPEGVTETFEESWLRGEGLTAASPAKPSLWGHERQSCLAFSDLDALVGDPAQLRDWLVGVRDLGFGLVENVPTTPGFDHGSG